MFVPIESEERHELFERVRAFAYLAAAKLTLNPQTARPGYAAPKFPSHECIGPPPQAVFC